MKSAEQASCKYHPKQQAAWFCSSCKTYFCSECNPSNQNYPKCVLCRRSLVSLSIAQKIPPLSQKLASLLTIPLKAMPLYLVIAMSILISLLPFNKIGLILLMIMLMPVVEFLFEAMEQIASGEKLQIKSATYFSFEKTGLFIKLLATCFMLVFVLIKIHAISALVANLLALFFIIGLPASLVILMMEKSMIAMINPLKISYIIKLFSGAYWFAFVWLAGIFCLNFLLHPILNSGVNHIAQSCLINFISLYLSLCLFLILGYLVYQYHFELNFKIAHQFLPSSSINSQTGSMAEVEIFIQEGRFEDAQTLLLDRIAKNPLDYKASEKLIFLYAIQDKNYFLNRIAQQYFVDLIAANKIKHAADFYCELKKREIDFYPDNIEVIIAISHEMKNNQQSQFAIELIKLFLTKNPFPSKWEDIYMNYAQLLAEFANNQFEAKKMISSIIQKTQDEEKRVSAKKYLQLIN